MEHLSNGDWTLMNALWERQPATVAQLVHALAPETGWSKHTVMTMLSRLEQKGAVSCTQGERAREYSALLARDKAAARETDSFLSKVYGGSLGLMVNSMLRAHSLSDEEVEELRALLGSAEGGGGK